MKCIEIKNLTFKYGDTTIFEDFSLDLYSNNCYVLSGLNGCGKSTLLKLIGGKTICRADTVKVLSKDPFRDTTCNGDITFINNDWGTRTVAYAGYNMPIQSSLKVKEMMIALKEQFPERNQELLQVLDINPEWSLNGVSEGQRKRVQLYLSLIKPFKICLLDEITVNLDLLVKDKFMKYLKNESLKRQCCIIYVTHIFDGLEEWGTKLIYLKKTKDVVITEMSLIPCIYQHLLSRFKSESPNCIEPEENSYDKRPKTNAGGYSNGVLVGLEYK